MWRILREFEKRGLPLTVFGVATALQKHRELAQAFAELGHEVACHGLKWIHYQNVPEEIERAHMAQAMEIFEDLYGHGDHGLGWYTGRDSPNSHRLVADDGRFAYDSDYYGDDLPFWMSLEKTDGSHAPPAHRALHAGRERHALCPAPGLFARRPVLPVHEGHASTRCTPRATPPATTRPR